MASVSGSDYLALSYVNLSVGPSRNTAIRHSDIRMNREISENISKLYPTFSPAGDCFFRGGFGVTISGSSWDGCM